MRELLPLSPPPSPLSLLYLWELINLLQALFDLEPSPVARDPVHHGHHGLLDHFPVDEALQDLGDLQAVLSIAGSELLNLKHEACWAGAQSLTLVAI